MYHVKNDKRCIRSAESIMNALEQLMAKKAFLDITITDIQKTAGIGRSTFYRLFDTIDDVVTYMVDREFEEIVRGYSMMSKRDFTID
ncbi:MAG: TetR/AcrR family transcriptional regulator, partial [Mogibacterium sp.]|nr:TetR/AcrR family transcriptional regulator [Mogibacterium sp.]